MHQCTNYKGVRPPKIAEIGKSCASPIFGRTYPRDPGAKLTHTGCP